MRLKRSIALALILLIAGLAPGCVANVNGTFAGCASSQRAVSHKKPGDRCARAKDGGKQLRAQASRCGFRSFVQLQFAKARPAAAEPPKLHVHGKVAAQPAVTVSLSSIGLPQSDRGPPLLLES